MFFMEEALLMFSLMGRTFFPHGEGILAAVFRRTMCYANG